MEDSPSPDTFAFSEETQQSVLPASSGRPIVRLLSHVKHEGGLQMV